MENVNVSREKLVTLFSDMERMVCDFESLAEFDDIVVTSRLNDVKSRKVNGLSEKDLDAYLRKRGVKVD